MLMIVFHIKIFITYYLIINNGLNSIKLLNFEQVDYSISNLLDDWNHLKINHIQDNNTNSQKIIEIMRFDDKINCTFINKKGLNNLNINCISKIRHRRSKKENDKRQNLSSLYYFYLLPQRVKQTC